jgi:hypothetical protein
VHETALLELNQITPNARRGCVNGDRQVLDAALPFL